MAFDGVADLRDQGGHIFSTFLEVTAPRIEDRFELFHQEGDIAAFTKHGGDDPGKGDDPLKVIHILRIDEDFEGAAQFVGGDPYSSN